jgi:signal transduction histidine kinase
VSATALLDVRDDGVGFEPGAKGGGFGLTSMRQRLRNGMATAVTTYAHRVW